MVSVPRCSEDSVPEIRHSPDRPLCLQQGSSSAEVHVAGQIGQQSDGSGRSESTVGSTVSVRIPPADVGTFGSDQTERLVSEDAAGSAVLERRPLAVSTSGAMLRRASSSSPGPGSPSERDDESAGQVGVPEAHSLAAMRQAVGEYDISDATLSVVEQNWRRGTRQQYQTVWRSWCRWCASEHLDTATVSVKKLLDYLQHLKDHGLAWRTLCVHRSGISSLLEPHKDKPVGQDRLVCRFLKGVFNINPPRVRVVPTWDVNQVLVLLASWHPAADISLHSLAKKVAFLLALCSARRISDLVLFSVDQSLCFLGPSRIVLQAKFGSKTDRPSHVSPPFVLKSCDDVRLCPVSYLKCYIERTVTLRGTDQLFISSSPPHAPVKLNTLRRWITDVLEECGVHDSAGSTRANAATRAMLNGISLQRLMTAGDWSRRTTPLRHYMRILPSATLQVIAEQSAADVQSSVLA